MEYEYYIETGEFNKASFNEISFEIIPETLCQCTGLQDIDGKDIFENDIVEYLEDIDYPEWNEYNETFEEHKLNIEKYEKENDIKFYEKYGQSLIKKTLTFEIRDEPYFGYKQLHRGITDGSWDTNNEKTLKIIGNKFDKEED